MKILRFAGALAALAVIAAGCEDITNPVEEQGQLVGPYVRFETHTAIGTPESTVLAIFQMPTRVPENVTIHYAFAGDAVYGEDYWAVDAQGNPLSGVSAQGGTATIEYDPDVTAFLRDTVRLYVPFATTNGRQIEVEITDAQTASGKTVETGYIERYQTFDVSLEGFVDIPEGTYTGVNSGDFGDLSATAVIQKADPAVEAGGGKYQFTISDFTGALLFGEPAPWAFNVTSGGNVLAPSLPYDPEWEGVEIDMSGTFDFDTNTLTLDVTFNCCGVAGAGYTMTLAPQ